MNLRPRAPCDRAPRVPPPRRSPTRLAAATRAFFLRASLRVLVGRVPRVLSPRRSSRPSRPLPVRSSTAPPSAHCGRRRCAANSQRSISACDRAARDPCKMPRVSQPLGPQRLWRPHGPRGSPPRGSRGVTTGRDAWAVAARISASATPWRNAMNAAVRVGGQRRRGGTRGSHPQGTRARGERRGPKTGAPRCLNVAPRWSSDPLVRP
jgi:hypothetical protein